MKLQGDGKVNLQVYFEAKKHNLPILLIKFRSNPRIIYLYCYYYYSNDEQRTSLLLGLHHQHRQPRQSQQHTGQADDVLRVAAEQAAVVQR